MKKNHRRFSMIAMLIAMLLFSSVTCFASGPIPPIDDSAGGNNIQRNVKDPTHVPRGAAEISQEELQVWLKENEKERLPQFESSSIKASTASWIYTHNTSYTFYYYGQELYYSCGAASVRMALKGLSNLNLSESEIRQGCKTDAGGTFVKYMTPYLN
ncbi:MAG: hypothetical protein IK016_11450, partial [Lachnospiraceae bacterium]|nr:hypothetical protein [Lachnospiraceae bacterium]